MMRITLTCLLAAATTLAHAQARPPQKSALASPAATQSSTPTPAPPTLKKPDERAPEAQPNQPVITVRGLCVAETGPAAKATVPSTKQCLITVTREQFDALLRAFNPTNQPVSPAMRRQVAQAYVELLVFSEAAKSAGVENKPEYKEVMRVLRLRTLTDVYRNELNEQFRNPSPEEIEAYYKENASRFEGAKVSRVYLPKTFPGSQATEDQKKAYQAKLPQVADDVQARAAKNEALDKVQKDAYVTLGINAEPPNTELNATRRGAFPPKLDQDIFSRPVGDVFRTEDANGYTIYRIDSRQPLPLDSVKEEISREILRRKMDDKLKELTAPVHTDYDETYFGPLATPGAPASTPPAPNQPK